MKDSKPNLEEEYPEHLRHLYQAEQEKLNKEEQMNKDRRRQGRCVDEGLNDDSDLSSSVKRTSETGIPESGASLNEGPQTSQTERFVISHTGSPEPVTVFTVHKLSRCAKDLRFSCNSLMMTVIWEQVEICNFLLKASEQK